MRVNISSSKPLWQQQVKSLLKPLHSNKADVGRKQLFVCLKKYNPEFALKVKLFFINSFEKMKI